MPSIRGCAGEPPRRQGHKEEREKRATIVPYSCISFESSWRSWRHGGSKFASQEGDPRMANAHPPTIPILGSLKPGTTQRHRVTLPGAALADEPRPVTTITGAKPGPVLFIGAGVHGGEYPAVETVIRLSTRLNAAELSGTVVLMPVLNLPAFWKRSMFVCPIDDVNPNRVFPGDPNGTYSEQMTHALVNEFIIHADAYIDLHGGDIPEALVPFSICRKGNEPADTQAVEL